MVAVEVLLAPRHGRGAPHPGRLMRARGQHQACRLFFHL